jgi:sterol desaturase/sphingolipid hydroxylase (fatty acid hydroxylase superfamily)
VLHAATPLLQNAAQSLAVAGQLFILSALVFCSLALVMKGREAIAAGHRAIRQIRINIELFIIDALVIAPGISVLVQLIRTGVDHYGLHVVSTSYWDHAGAPATAVAAVFLGDFSSYWRHRLEHTRLLWPSHAIHHSDTEMNWLTLARFHPINRLTTSACDLTFLALLGFPAWALVVNELIRHAYGEFIHADLPWTYGKFSRLFVSPAMHQWHHIRDVDGSGYNFATIFSVFDQAFGTYHVPGPCTVALGVNDHIGPGTVGQLVYPFVAWAETLGWRRRA